MNKLIIILAIVNIIVYSLIGLSVIALSNMLGIINNFISL